MSSSRLILFFLGIIFLIIVILSSQKIGGFLREKFGRFLPPIKPPFEEVITPSPTLSTLVPTPTSVFVPSPTSFPGFTPVPSISLSGGTPATGPKEAVFLFFAGSFLLGFFFKKQSARLD